MSIETVTETIVNTYTGEEVVSKHREALFRQAMGGSLEEVASFLGMSLQGAATVCGSPMWIKELEVIKKEIESKLGERIDGTEVDRQLGLAEVEAAVGLRGLIKSPIASISLKAATEVLDRRGYVKVQKSEVSQTHSFELPEAQAKLLSETLRQVDDMKEDGEVEIIDVEGRVVE